MAGQVDEGQQLNQIPVLHVCGTHYECGYAIGRQFRSMIEDLVAKWDYLNDVLVLAYLSQDGREIYDRSLSLCTQKFPQYVEELQGIADGSKTPFYKLFLFHIDTLIIRPDSEKVKILADTGCTSVMSNSDYGAIIGHTEDALPEFLNNVYIISAEIVDENGSKREKFTTLTYAGHLPGYTMGFNEYGLVYTINSIFPTKTMPYKTPKMFLTRAVLGASNFVQVLNILRDVGTGSADGFSLNITFANQEGAPVMHNVEVGPNTAGKSESELSVLNLTHGDVHVHCNKYLRLDIQQSLEIALDSSNHRHRAIEQHPKPACVQDLKEILSDQKDCEYPVYRSGRKKPDFVKTVAVGIFDIPRRIWSIYMRPPNGSDPVAEIPLKF